jgi:hypothetical protein
VLGGYDRCDEWTRDSYRIPILVCRGYSRLLWNHDFMLSSAGDCSRKRSKIPFRIVWHGAGRLRTHYKILILYLVEASRRSEVKNRCRSRRRPRSGRRRGSSSIRTTATSVSRRQTKQSLRSINRFRADFALIFFGLLGECRNPKSPVN